jgi:hypothetical protein
MLNRAGWKPTGNEPDAAKPEKNAVHRDRFPTVRTLETVSRSLRLFPMPRYFFHVYHDQTLIDDEGEELPDKHAAWREATVMAGQTLQGLDGKLQPDRDWRMEVTDEFNEPLFILHIHAEKPR